MSRHHHTTAAGFTLLEAIVALAIIGTTLVPIMSFISLSANELIKAAEANERSFAKQAAIAMMDPVNPSSDPTGSLPLNESIILTWESQELVPPGGATIVSNTGLPTRRLGFYEVRVIVSRDGQGWFDFEMRKVGYAEVDPFQPPADRLQ